jgi:hypothetical protein
MGGHNDPDEPVVPFRVSLLNGLRTVVYGIVAGLSLAGLRPAEKVGFATKWRTPVRACVGVVCAALGGTET